MNQSDLLFYFRLFLGRLPLVALCALPLAALGLVVAFTLPPTYRASARILVEAPDIPSEMARSTVVTSSFEQFQIIQQEVTTQRHLLDMAERIGIYGNDASQPDDIADDLRSRIQFEQIAMDAPQGQTRAVIFGISFEARDSALAAKVVNDLVDYILNKNKRLREDQAEITRSFFDGEVARLGDSLKEIESKILEFRNSKQAALPDSLDFRRSQLQGSQERTAQLEREDASLRSRRSNLQQMLGGQIQGAGPLSPERQLLQDLNRALAEQLTVYREDSPTIAVLRARIDTVTRSLEAEKSGDRPHGPTEFDLQMSDIDERLDFISDERTRLKKTMASLSQSITETPSNEARLNEMERGRDNIQAQYNLAVSKLSEAATGEQIELSAKGSRFTLVEPATPPRDPVRPKRFQIALLSIFGGFAAGIGLVVLLELLNTKVRRPAELTNLIGTQPLVTVPYVYTRHEKRKLAWQSRIVGRFVSDRKSVGSNRRMRASIGAKS